MKKALIYLTFNFLISCTGLDWLKSLYFEGSTNSPSAHQQALQNLQEKKTSKTTTIARNYQEFIHICMQPTGKKETVRLKYHDNFECELKINNEKKWQTYTYKECEIFIKEITLQMNKEHIETTCERKKVEKSLIRHKNPK